MASSQTNVIQPQTSSRKVGLKTINWKQSPSCQPPSPQGPQLYIHGSYPRVYRRSKIDKDTGKKIPHGKWLPRMKPRREQLSSGEKLIHEHLPLGGYDTPQDAETVWFIAAFYYGKAEGKLTLANGQKFSIPHMTEEEKQSLHGIEKRQWVCRKTREVFEDFQKALKVAASLRNAALVSAEVAMAVIASSPESLRSLHLASPSPEDSTFNQVYDIGGAFDISGIPPATDFFSLPMVGEGDVLRSTSKELAPMEADHVQQQLWDFHDLQLQRQLQEAQMQISKLQRQLTKVSDADLKVAT